MPVSREGSDYRPPGGTETELTSWKAIAEYLGVSVRTAQNWERERGLPVKRLPGERGPVWCTPGELAEWRVRTFMKQGAFSGVTAHRRYWVAGLAIPFLALAAWYVLRSDQRSPAGFHLGPRTLFINDQTGRQLWSKTFEEPFSTSSYSPDQVNSRIWFGELDGSPGPEVLFIYVPASPEKTGTRMICYGGNGEEKWHFTPSVRQTGGGDQCPPAYLISSFLVTHLKAGGPRRVFVTSQNVCEHPSQLAMLEDNGRLAGQYDYPGRLAFTEAADMNLDGVTEILLGGVDLGHNAASLVILDPGKIPAGPAGSAQQSAAGSSTPGVEEAVFLFPRTCINGLLEQYNEVAGVRAVNGASIEVRVREKSDCAGCYVYYYFNRQFQFTGYRWATSLKNVHRGLELSGQIKHSVQTDENRPDWKPRNIVTANREP